MERGPRAFVWDLNSVGSKRRVLSISGAGLGLGTTGPAWERVLGGCFLINLLPGCRGCLELMTGTGFLSEEAAS